MITSLIDFLRDTQDSSDYEIGGGVSEKNIENAQQILGVVFPATYRKFLREVGWLEINNVYFFGVRKDGVPDDNEGNVISITDFARKTWHLPNYLIVVYSAEDRVLWCIDTTINDKEAPVIAYDTQHQKITGKVAPDYWTCISQYLEEN